VTEGVVLIRDFRMQDLDPVLTLLPRCFAKEFEVSGLDQAHMKEMARRAYGLPGSLFMARSRLVGRVQFKFLVADLNDEVVGTTMVSMEGAAGYISTVMVSPDHRRRGIATKLMTGAIAYIRERGMKTAALHVISTNAPARGAYSKLGFETFEDISYLVGDVGSLRAQGHENGVEIRPFRRTDLEEVYRLHSASEDPGHLHVFGLRKSQLKTPFMERLFHFSTRRRIVAVRAGTIVGSADAVYTTPMEAGSLSSIEVRPEDRSGGIESMLVGAAIDVIRRGGSSRVVARVPTTRPETAEVLKGLGLTEAMVLVGMSREIRQGGAFT